MRSIVELAPELQALPAERQAKLRAGLDPHKEADTLRSWHLGNTKG